jgi:hypothetical protein
MILTPESFTRAREFLRQHARPLERARYCRHFGCTPVVDARAALAAFQNPDGGFGRALEPDFRLPASSAIATSVAFQHLRELGIPASDPMVSAAVRWTQAAFDPSLERWPAVPPAVNDWPHAPWWTWSGPGERGFAANPGVELVAHLWHYNEVADPAFLAAVTEHVERLVAVWPAMPEMHDLFCLLRLVETPAAPAALRNQAADRVRATAGAVVTRDPQAWSSYSVKPLLMAPRADSLLAPLLDDCLGPNLDYEIEHQGADGAWAPNWHWFGLSPEHWPEAEQEWKGVLTLQMLLTLRSYGRLPPVEHEAVSPTYAQPFG